MFFIFPSQTREYLLKKYTKYYRKYVLCSSSSPPKHGSIYSKNKLNIMANAFFFGSCVHPSYGSCVFFTIPKEPRLRGLNRVSVSRCACE